MLDVGGNSNGEGEEGAVFANRGLMLEHDFSHSALEELNIEMAGAGGGLQWDTSLSGQFNTRAGRYYSGLPRK
jgi:GATA-binding protein